MAIFRGIDFNRVPIPEPLPALSFYSLPLLAFIWTTLNQKADKLQTVSIQHYDPNFVEEVDFIVVGAGSAGSAVASRLSDTGKYTVLLLELGGDPNPLSAVPLISWAMQRCPGVDLMYETLPQQRSCLALENQVMFWPRGTGLGGSSNLNNQIYARGNPQDYDNWANLTQNPLWTYDNLLPFFKRLEDYSGVYPDDLYHGRGGPISVEKVRQSYMEDYYLNAVRELGYNVQDSNAYQTDGFSQMEITSRNGLRSSTYKGYLEPRLTNPNLIVHRFSRVIKVHLDKTNHAYGVTYIRHGVHKFARARKEIILSAGSIDTPKILMLSGIGPKEHLQSIGVKCKLDHPGIGNNLQDHVYSLMGPFLVDTNESLILSRDVHLDNLRMVQLPKVSGPLGSINGASAIGYITTSQRPHDLNWADIQYTFSAFRRLFGLRNRVISKYLDPYHERDANWIVTVLVRPRSKGYIRLRNRSPTAKPIIQPNYFSDPRDIAAIIEGFKFNLRVFEETLTYQRINARLSPTPFPGCEGLPFRSDAYFNCFIRHMTFTIYHPVGTAAMGRAGDPHAVVDPELRVFGTTGLRVIDASVMPVIVNANTNIPSIMIGEVGASLILKDWEAKEEELDVSLLQQSFHEQNELRS